MNIDIEFILRVLLMPQVLISIGAAFVLILLFRFVAVGGIKKPTFRLPVRIKTAPSDKAKGASGESEAEDKSAGPSRKRPSRDLDDEDEDEAPKPAKKRKK